MEMLEAHEASAYAAAQQRIMDEYEALVAAGEAPAGLSPQEIAELLSSVESEEAQIKLQAKEDKRALRDAATSAMAAARRIDLQQYVLEQKAAGENADIDKGEIALLEEVMGIDFRSSIRSAMRLTSRCARSWITVRSPEAGTPRHRE